MVSDFLAMGGYGGYVWTSYGLFFLVLIADAIAPLLQQRTTLRALAARLKRQAAKKTS